MPSRLRPTASFAADAILVGDPGRALLLAQELLEKPKMSNHARGLWGYSGLTPAGDELTIQSTGMGGPSAALVLADLAELGVRRAVRVGSCVATGTGGVGAGELVLVERALAGGGSAAAFGVAVGDAGRAGPGADRGPARALGDGARPATVASFDAGPAHRRAGFADGRRRRRHADGRGPGPGRALGIAAAAVLIVVEARDGRSARGGAAGGRRRNAPDGPPLTYSQPLVEG